MDQSIIPTLRTTLLHWYQQAKRQLPWRKTSNPYEIWVSEVMLQQTQTRKVLDYYSRFLQCFPDIESLARASLDAVLKAWEGLGYYARARNLHKAARFLAEHNGGNLPDSYAELRKIPGIGAYTAAAIASIAFSEPHAVLDGNVVRVLCRLYRVQEYPREAAVKARLGELAATLLDTTAAGDFNQAMMELGATICTPRNPKCVYCPLAEFCRAYKQMANPAELPVKAVARQLPHYQIAVGLIWDEGLLFIDRRQENGLLGGLWEFPGGKVEAEETPQEAVQREISEELDLEIEVGDFFMEVKHAYTHFKITLQVYHCLYKGGEPKLSAATDWRWVKPKELDFYAFATANKKIIRKLANEFAGGYSNGNRPR